MPQPDQVASLAVPTAADPRRWKALGVLALIQFMLSLDITVVNIALPQNAAIWGSLLRGSRG